MRHIIETCVISQRHVLYHIDMWCVTQTGCVIEGGVMAYRPCLSLYIHPYIPNGEITRCHAMSSTHVLRCYLSWGVMLCHTHMSWGRTHMSWGHRQMSWSVLRCHFSMPHTCLEVSCLHASLYTSTHIYRMDKWWCWYWEINRELLEDRAIRKAMYISIGLQIWQQVRVCGCVCVCWCCIVCGCACVWVCGSVGVNVGRHDAFIWICVYIRM